MSTLNMILIILLVICLVSIILILKSKKRIIKVISGSIILLSIITFCSLEITPLLDKINFGLDLQGGFEVLYQVTPLREDQELDSNMV